MTNLEENVKSEPSRTCNIQVQFNGKVDSSCLVECKYTWQQFDIINYIRSLYQYRFVNKRLVKTIYIPDTLINFVLDGFIDDKEKFEETQNKCEELEYANLEGLSLIDNTAKMEFRISSRNQYNFLPDFNNSLKKRAWWFIWKQKWYVKIPMGLWSTVDAKVWNIRVLLSKVLPNIRSRMSQLINRVTTFLSHLNPWKKQNNITNYS